MRNITEVFQSHVDTELKDFDIKKIRYALTEANDEFLKYYKFKKIYEIGSAYNYYYESNHSIKRTPLHEDLLMFWEVFKDFYVPDFFNYIIVRTCKTLVLYNHMIESCNDDAYVYRELINSFGKYFDLSI